MYLYVDVYLEKRWLHELRLIWSIFNPNTSSIVAFAVYSSNPDGASSTPKAITWNHFILSRIPAIVLYDFQFLKCNIVESFQCAIFWSDLFFRQRLFPTFWIVENHFQKQEHENGSLLWISEVPSIKSEGLSDVPFIVR